MGDKAAITAVVPHHFGQNHMQDCNIISTLQWCETDSGSQS